MHGIGPAADLRMRPLIECGELLVYSVLELFALSSCAFVDVSETFASCGMLHDTLQYFHLLSLSCKFLGYIPRQLLQIKATYIVCFHFLFCFIMQASVWWQPVTDYIIHMPL